MEKRWRVLNNQHLKYPIQVKDIVFKLYFCISSFVSKRTFSIFFLGRFTYFHHL